MTCKGVLCHRARGFGVVLKVLGQGYDRKAALYDTKTGDLWREVEREGDVKNLVFSNLGDKLLAVGSSDGKAALYDPRMNDMMMDVQCCTR